MGVELMDSSVFWYAVLAVVVVALVFILFNFNKVKKLKEGTDEMIEMAGIIRSGAGTFLKAEFKLSLLWYSVYLWKPQVESHFCLAG